MRDKELNKQWMKENKVMYSINLMRSTDMDIIDYINTTKENGGTVQGAIKEAIRFFLAYKDSVREQELKE